MMRLAKAHQYAFNSSGRRWLMAANIEVMHQFRDPLQCHLAQAKARQQRFKGDLVSYMGEGRSIEIKTQRVIRAISWRA